MPAQLLGLADLILKKYQLEDLSLRTSWAQTFFLLQGRQGILLCLLLIEGLQPHYREQLTPIPLT